MCNVFYCVSILCFLSMDLVLFGSIIQFATQFSNNAYLLKTKTKILLLVNNMFK